MESNINGNNLNLLGNPGGDGYSMADSVVAANSAPVDFEALKPKLVFKSLSDPNFDCENERPLSVSPSDKGWLATKEHVDKERRNILLNASKNVVNIGRFYSNARVDPNGKIEVAPISEEHKRYAGAFARRVLFPRLNSSQLKEMGFDSVESLGEAVINQVATHSRTPAATHLIFRKFWQDNDEKGAIDYAKTLQEANNEKNVYVPKSISDAEQFCRAYQGKRNALYDFIGGRVANEDELREAWALSLVSGRKLSDSVLNTFRSDRDLEASLRVVGAANAIRAYSDNSAFTTLATSFAKTAVSATKGMISGVELPKDTTAKDWWSFVNEKILDSGGSITTKDKIIGEYGSYFPEWRKEFEKKQLSDIRSNSAYYDSTTGAYTGLEVEDSYKKAHALRTNEDYEKYYSDVDSIRRFEMAMGQSELLSEDKFRDSEWGKRFLAGTGSTIGYMLPYLAVGALTRRIPLVGGVTSKAVSATSAFSMYRAEMLADYARSGDVTTSESERQLAANIYGGVGIGAMMIGLEGAQRGTVSLYRSAAGKVGFGLGRKAVDFSKRGLGAWISDAVNLETRLFVAKYGNDLLSRSAMLAGKIIVRESVNAGVEGLEEAIEEALRFGILEFVNDSARDYSGRELVDSDAIVSGILSALKDGAVYSIGMRGFYGAGNTIQTARRLLSKVDDEKGNARRMLGASTDAIIRAVGSQQSAMFRNGELLDKDSRYAGFKKAENVARRLFGVSADERAVIRDSAEYKALNDKQRQSIEELVGFYDKADGKGKEMIAGALLNEGVRSFEGKVFTEGELNDALRHVALEEGRAHVAAVISDDEAHLNKLKEEKRIREFDEAQAEGVPSRNEREFGELTDDELWLEMKLGEQELATARKALSDIDADIAKSVEKMKATGKTADDATMVFSRGLVGDGEDAKNARNAVRREYKSLSDAGYTEGAELRRLLAQSAGFDVLSADEETEQTRSEAAERERLQKESEASAEALKRAEIEEQRAAEAAAEARRVLNEREREIEAEHKREMAEGATARIEESLAEAESARIAEEAAVAASRALAEAEAVRVEAEAAAEEAERKAAAARYVKINADLLNRAQGDRDIQIAEIVSWIENYGISDEAAARHLVIRRIAQDEEQARMLIGLYRMRTLYSDKGLTAFFGASKEMTQAFIELSGQVAELGLAKQFESAARWVSKRGWNVSPDVAAIQRGGVFFKSFAVLFAAEDIDGLKRFIELNVGIRRALAARPDSMFFSTSIDGLTASKIGYASAVLTFGEPNAQLEKDLRAVLDLTEKYPSEKLINRLFSSELNRERLSREGFNGFTNVKSKPGDFIGLIPAEKVIALESKADTPEESGVISEQSTNVEPEQIVPDSQDSAEITPDVGNVSESEYVEPEIHEEQVALSDTTEQSAVVESATEELKKPADVPEEVEESQVESVPEPEPVVAVPATTEEKAPTARKKKGVNTPAKPERRRKVRFYAPDGYRVFSEDKLKVLLPTRIPKSIKVKPFDIYDVVTKDPNRYVFSGVYHEDGIRVATDVKMLVQEKFDYPKEHEGKIVRKDGSFEERGTFPNWKRVIPSDDKVPLKTKLDVDMLLSAIARAKKIVGSIVRPETKSRSKIGLTVRFPLENEGEFAFVSADIVEVGLRWAKANGISEVRTGNGGTPILFKGNDTDVFIGMPFAGFGDASGEVGMFIDHKTGVILVADGVLSNPSSFVANKRDTIRLQAVRDSFTDEIEIEEAIPEEVDSTQETLPSERIDDFGEKIGGARKDLYHEYLEMLGDVTVDSLKSKPLSNVFPRPDVKALYEAGVFKTAEGAAYAQWLYNSIGVKPRRSWMSSSWAEKANQIANLLKSFISGEASADEMFKKVEANDSPMLKNLVLEVKTMVALGFPKEKVNLNGMRVRYMPSGDEHAYVLVKSNRIIADAKTFDDFVGILRGMLAVDKGDSQGRKPVKLAFFRDTVSRTVFIGVGTPGRHLKLKSGFEKLSEARAYLEANRESLENLYYRIKDVPSERNAENAERVGIDYRKGKDVSPAMFGETFGFRGVEFGNWVEQGRRQEDLNRAYDALMDLSEVLGVSPKALSLNGELGLAFGARGGVGRKGAAAHYEPDKVVINLTKTKGAGSLAHEWWHALDNYFGRKSSGDSLYYMTTSSKVNEGVRKEVADAFKEIRAGISISDIAARSNRLDKTRSSDYWGSIKELTARSFEAWVKDELSKRGYANDYLANITSPEQWRASYGDAETSLEGASYPYPVPDEMEQIGTMYRALADTMDEREQDGRVELYQISDELGQTISKEDQKLVAESVSGFIPGVKVSVVSDSEFDAKVGSLSNARLQVDQERARIEREAKANGTWLKAPNGKPSNLNAHQWVEVRTKAFKEWFGDWESDPVNSSKVVDANGEPLVVYHGTDSDFNTFDVSMGRRGSDIQGMFFSPLREESEEYGTNIRAFFLNIRNEASGDVAYNTFAKFKGQSDAGVKAREALTELEYDGANFSGEEYIAFLPEQIKSSTDNVGSYDAANPDIRYLRSNDGNVFGFYNSTTKEVVVRENARIDTLLHELGWHATWDWARNNSPELYSTMRAFAEQAPAELKERVALAYGYNEGKISYEEFLDEVGAAVFSQQNSDLVEGMLTGLKGRGITTKAKRLWALFVEAVKKAWAKLTGRYEKLYTDDGKRVVDLQGIVADNPAAAMRELAEAFVEGKALRKGMLSPAAVSDISRQASVLYQRPIVNRAANAAERVLSNTSNGIVSWDKYVNKVLEGYGIREDVANGAKWNSSRSFTMMAANINRLYSDEGRKRAAEIRSRARLERNAASRLSRKTKEIIERYDIPNFATEEGGVIGWGRKVYNIIRAHTGDEPLAMENAKVLLARQYRRGMIDVLRGGALLDAYEMLDRLVDTNNVEKMLSLSEEIETQIKNKADKNAIKELRENLQALIDKYGKSPKGEDVSKQNVYGGIQVFLYALRRYGEKRSSSEWNSFYEKEVQSLSSIIDGDSGDELKFEALQKIKALELWYPKSISDMDAAEIMSLQDVISDAVSTGKDAVSEAIQNREADLEDRFHFTKLAIANSAQNAADKGKAVAPTSRKVRMWLDHGQSVRSKMESLIKYADEDLYEKAMEELRVFDVSITESNNMTAGLIANDEYELFSAILRFAGKESKIVPTRHGFGYIGMARAAENEFFKMMTPLDGSEKFSVEGEKRNALQLMAQYMMMRQKEWADMFAGKTEDQIPEKDIKVYRRWVQNEELGKFLGEKRVAFAKDVSRIMQEHKNEIDKQSVRDTGMTMSYQGEDYFPIVHNMNNYMRGVLPVVKGGVPSVIPKILTPRKHSRLDIDESADILSIFRRNTFDIAQYVSFGETGIGSAIRGVLGSDSMLSTRENIARIKGENGANALWVHLAQVLNGRLVGAEFYEMNTSINKAFGLTRWLTRVLGLGLNIVSGAKQVAGGLPAYAYSYGYRKTLSALMQNPSSTIDGAVELFESDGYAQRYGNNPLSRSVFGAKIAASIAGENIPKQLLREALRFENSLMVFTSYGDRIPLFTVGASIYVAMKNEYVAQGKTIEDAKRFALRDFWTLQDRTQQSRQIQNMDEITRSMNPILGSFIQFLTSPMQFLSDQAHTLELAIARGDLNHWKKAMAVTFHNHVLQAGAMAIVSMIARIVFNGDDDDEEEFGWFTKREWSQFLVGSTPAIPIFGDVFESFVLDAVFGETTYGTNMFAPTSAETASKVFRRADNFLESLFDGEDDTTLAAARKLAESSAAIRYFNKAVDRISEDEDDE